MKIVFAGTTPFSAFHLDLLIKSKNEVAAVLTQPDRKSGRGKNLKPSPVKTFSEKEGFAEGIVLPDKPQIQTLYPNPFNPVLSVSFSIPTDAVTRVAIFNTLGEEVDVIRSNEMLSAGHHTFFWNATDQTSGMYLVQIQSGRHTDTQKALLVK